MTGVVDDSRDGTAVVRHDPGHQDRVVSRTVGIEAPDELAGSFVPGVAVGGEITAATAVEDGDWPGLAHRSRGQAPQMRWQMPTGGVMSLRAMPARQLV
jgi:hypothetical protein